VSRGLGDVYKRQDLGARAGVRGLGCAGLDAGLGV